MNILNSPDPAFMQEEEITLFSDSVGKWIDEHAPLEKVQQWIADSSVPRQLPARRRRHASEPQTVPDNLLRLSVGIEDVDDLWADLDRALRG